MTELGSGWAPAVADTYTELKFIQQQERLSSNDQSYWIGGLAYQTLESQGFSEGKTYNIKSKILLISVHIKSIYIGMKTCIKEGKETTPKLITKYLFNIFILFTTRIISSDTHGWLLSKYVEGRGITDDISTLEVKEKSFQTYGILCETGNCIILWILVSNQYIKIPWI